ncbi:hypothetical protein SAMN05421841_0129 [Chryseobacterium wanjuense]|jgi:hypothetical protein|uniref:Uncharacterized protein n=1 Tax=Chryseobacterium wanjuense TaxID=356305 RepID=A0A1I0MQY7_9FLAO|nr:hypothetical protein SAMN05421841_0129 [Chryseobacterium wanjuense]
MYSKACFKYLLSGLECLKAFLMNNKNLLIDEINSEYRPTHDIHFIHLQSLMFNLSFHGY